MRKKTQNLIKRKVNAKNKETIDQYKAIQKKYNNRSNIKKLITNHDINKINKIEKEISEEENEIKDMQWYEVPGIEEKSRIAWITGLTKKQERKKIIEKSKNKEIDIIITTKLFDKAIKQMWHFAVM